MVEKRSKMTKPDILNEIVYFGPGMSNEEIDEKFKKLYECLLRYTNNICNLVQDLCPNCQDQLRLALNIAETDGNLMQRLVATECEKRCFSMKLKEEKQASKTLQKKPIEIHELPQIKVEHAHAK